MTLTLELSDLRTANQEALAQFSRTTDGRFDAELKEIEDFLLSVYRIAVLAVRSEHQVERAADVWRETLEVIDSAARQAQEVAARHGRAETSLDRVLELRSAASEMLALYACSAGLFSMASHPGSTQRAAAQGLSTLIHFGECQMG